MHQNPAIPLHAFSSATVAFGPRNAPWRVALQDPAMSVMTDFRDRAVFKVSPGENVDDALLWMKHAGLRAAFVMDPATDRMLGLITAYDIMGEKPLRYLESIGSTGSGMSRRDVRVADIMEKVEDWTVADMRHVAGATVQSVLDAIERSGRTHLPVMESGEGNEPRLRGLFSASKIRRLTEDSRGKHAL
jgi:CBS domain-containing protein